MQARTKYPRLVGVLCVALGMLGMGAWLPESGCSDVEQAVHGSGRLVRESREVDAFTSVTFGTTGDLDIEYANSESLLIEAEDKLLDQIETHVVDGELVIRHRGNVAPTPTKPMRFHLKVRELDRIAFSGSGLVSMSHLKTDRFEIRHSGSGRVLLGDLQVHSLAVHCSGSGDVRCDRVRAQRSRLIVTGAGDTHIRYLEGLSTDVRLTGSGKVVLSEGSVVEQEILVSGSGELRAEGLHSAQTEVMVSGCGKAVVHAETLLDVIITGSGDIHFRGHPQQVRSSISGSGELRRL